MPKIGNIPNSVQESFGIDPYYTKQRTNNFNYLPIKSQGQKQHRINNSRYANNDKRNGYQQQPSHYKSFYDNENKVVPIHQVKYNPQFCKSPLASVVMNRKEGYHNQFKQLDIQTNNKKEYDYGQYQNQNQNSKCSPTILAILGILALIALIIGLFFIFRSISNKNQSNIPTYNLNDLQDGKVSGGVKPIQIQPVSYNPNTNLNTYYQTEQPYSTNPLPTFSIPKIQPKSYQNPPYQNNPSILNTNLNLDEEFQNSISPINVYASKTT